MKKEAVRLGRVPCLVWGEDSDKVFLHVHGKQSRKEYAEDFAAMAERHGWQTVSFDLPRHGDRADSPEPCDVWEGIADLCTVMAWARAQWPRMGLFACSLGAFFALHAYVDAPFEHCLFQSPIVDMDELIHRMYGWFGVTEEQLRQSGEISTPIDTLSWRYAQWVKEHPVVRWTRPTSILYAEKDNMQALQTMQGFAERFGCRLTVAPGCEHPFMAAGDAQIVHDWLEECLCGI